MENEVLDISLYKTKSKKNMFKKVILVIVSLVLVLAVTLYNNLIYQVIGKDKFIIVYSIGLALCIAYIVLYYCFTLPNEDIVFMELGGTKKEEEFYTMFSKEEKHKLGKKALSLKIISNVLEYYFIIIIAILFVVVMFTFIFFPAQVEQHSMETTFFEGDRVLVFNSNKASKGDVVVFRYDAEYQRGNSSLDGDLLIKRVVASAGDSFECINGNIYVNGVLVIEDYVNVNNFKDSSYTLEDVVRKNKNSSELLELIKDGKIPEGYYLVLGDNRKNSNDSEEFGLVYYKQLAGVVKYYKNDFGWHKN